MIYQMSCPAPDLLFVASSRDEDGPAEMEIAQWAVQHGFQPPQDARTFVFYRDGEQARAWRLIRRTQSVSGTEH